MYKKIITLSLCLCGYLIQAQLVNNGASIVIESGATLVVEGSIENDGGDIKNQGTLEIKDNLVNNGGTFTGVKGKIIFSGISNSTVDLNSASLTCDSLIIMKTSGADVSLNDNSSLTVNKKLIFSSSGSHLLLGNSNLTISDEAGAEIQGADDTKFVVTDGTGSLQKMNSTTGSMFTYEIGASDSEYNPIEVTIDATGTAETIGARTISNAHQNGPGESDPVVENAADVQWEVTGTNTNVLDVKVEWDESSDELTGFTSDTAGLSRWDETEMYWDLTLDSDGFGSNDEGGGKWSASRDNVSPGTFAVGAEGVMDYLLIAPKIFLGGPYNATSDNMNANITGMLPTSEPYGIMTAFTHEGLGGREKVSSHNAGDVDWVFLELRDAAGSTVLGTCSAILRSDGSIVAPEKSELRFHGFKGTGNNYKLAIKHRNHLGVLTDAFFVSGRSNPGTPLDFTTNNLATGTNAMQSFDGSFQMWPGNSNGNSNIKFNGVDNDVDQIRNIILGEPSNFLNILGYTLTGSYHASDVNLDGNVKFNGADNDVDVIRNAILAHPGNFLNILGYTINSSF